MKILRKILGHKLFIHGLVLLGMLALWGYVETGIRLLMLGIAASFAGAVCGAFIRVIDKIDSRK